MKKIGACGANVPLLWLVQKIIHRVTVLTLALAWLVNCILDFTNLGPCCSQNAPTLPVLLVIRVRVVPGEPN